jgi:hypothetical protein
VNEPAEDRYRAVHAYLSDDAHATWQEVATQYGVSVSGLIEAMGADLQRPEDERVLGPQLSGLVTRARRIDADRRRRRGRTPSSRPSDSPSDRRRP